MSNSIRNRIPMKGTVLASEINLEISRATQKTLLTQEIDEKKILPVGATKVASKSYRNKKYLLFPPFLGRGTKISSQGEESGDEVVEISVPETRSSDTLGIPSGCCEDDDEIRDIFGIDDHRCLGKISGADNEDCTIMRGTDTIDDVCEDVVYKGEDKPGSRFYMTACGEGVDNVISENQEEGSVQTLTDVENATIREDPNEIDVLEFPETEWDIQYEGFTEHEWESGSESIPETELQLQDPMVSHRLTIPYTDMPSARYEIAGRMGKSPMIKLLEKRPRSPIRNIANGRYDLHEGMAAVVRRAEMRGTKHDLGRSKEWMTKKLTSNLESTSKEDVNSEPLTNFLQVILEQVSLSLVVDESGNDLSLSLATVWAITEVIMTKMGSETMQSLRIESLGLVPKSKRSLSYNLTLLRDATCPKTPTVGYPPRGSKTYSLHRAAPWVYLCGVHAEGQPKTYPTLRTCIDELTPDNKFKRLRASNLPDISCAHLKQIPSKRPNLPEVKNDEVAK